MDAEAAGIALEPLRERMPIYLRVFALGFGVAAAVGLVWGAFSGASFVQGVAWAVLAYGVLLLLFGGATGGGYTNIGVGAVGSIFGGRHQYDADPSDPDVRRGGVGKVDPRERLRKGLRPAANPTAFWQVVAGFAYVAIGVALLELVV